MPTWARLDSRRVDVQLADDLGGLTCESGDGRRDVGARPRLLLGWAGVLGAAELAAITVADRPGWGRAADPSQQTRLVPRRRGRGVGSHAPGSSAGTSRRAMFFEAHTPGMAAQKRADV